MMLVQSDIFEAGKKLLLADRIQSTNDHDYATACIRRLSMTLYMYCGHDCG